MIRVFASLMALCFSLSTAAAEERDKIDKLRELARLTGFHEMLNEQRAAGTAQARQVMDQTLAQLESALSPEAHPEAFEKLSQAARRFMAACEPAWTVEEAVERWLELYARGVSAEDVDTILAFYRSPAGQRDVAASRTAMKEWTAWLMAEQQPKFQAALSTYTSELQAIVAEAKANNRQ